MAHAPNSTPLQTRHALIQPLRSFAPSTMADGDTPMAPESSPLADFDAQPYIAHKLLTSSLCVYPPLPLSSTSPAATAAATASAPSESLVAQVLVCKGKWSEQMGHRAHAGRLYLHVEEMAYLLEQGMSEIEFEGAPISVEEMYALLHTTGVANALAHPASAYIAYTTLRNNGFVLMRPQQFARTHTPVRTGTTLPTAPAAATATASKPAAAPYSVLSIPPPQAKKGGGRRWNTDRPAPSATLTQEQLQQERNRLRVMQGWLPNYDVTTGSMVSESSAVASPPASSAGAPVPSVPSFSATAAQLAVAAPAPSLAPELHALLSTPCDAFCVWLPPGGGGGGTGSAKGAASFKKSAPGLPDFLCVVTNPWLTFERLWSARPMCTRSAVAEFQRQRRAARNGSGNGGGGDGGSAAALQAAYEPPCLGDVFTSMYAMSSERALLMSKADDSSTPGSSSSGSTVAASASLMPLRIAHVPVHQHRVFFADWPTMLPPPSCIDPTQHAHVLRSAASTSIFQ